MCVICNDPLFRKLNNAERKNAYIEILMTKFNGDASEEEEAKHILDLILDLEYATKGS